MGSGTVLVVDDEPLLLDSVSWVLNRRGYQVLRAEGPIQALGILRGRHHSIDVLLSDVMMPGMPGTELVHECIQITPDTICVLMTGGLVNDSEVPPGVRVLRKPISTKDLMAAVDAAAARSMELRADFLRLTEEADGLRRQAKRLVSECREVKSQLEETIEAFRRIREGTP
jgi:DNA-binding NtrC family response regulator